MTEHEGEVMVLESERIKNYIKGGYDGKAKPSQVFRRRQNGIQGREIRSRAKAEADNGKKNFPRIPSRDGEVSLAIENDTACKNTLEQETLTSILSREQELPILVENAETTNLTPDSGAEGFIENLQLVRSTLREKQVSVPPLVEVSPMRDSKLGQKKPSSPMIKSCKSSVSGVAEDEAKSMEEDRLDKRRSRRKRVKRSIDYPLVLRRPSKRLEKRCLSSGNLPDKVASMDTTATSNLFTKETCLLKASESNLQDNGCVGTPEMNSETRKRKKYKTGILQTKKQKKRDSLVDMLQTNPKLENNKDRRVTALEVKESKHMTVPIAETSEEGMVLSHYISGNSVDINTSGRSRANRTKNRLGHDTLAAMPNSDAVLRGSQAGSTSDIKGNSGKKLPGRKISEKIILKAKVKLKRKSKGALIKRQGVSLHISSKNRGTEKKPPISEIRKSLRERAKDHLLAAGWKIDLRPRRERDYQDSVYISPSGLSFWSLPRAWNALKHSLDEKVAKEGKLSDLVNDKRLPGNDSVSGLDLDCISKPFDEICGKLKLDTSSLEGSDVSAFMAMIYTEDLALLKRKRRNKMEDIDLLKRKKRNKEKNVKKSSKKGGKNGQVIKCVESIQLFRGKIKHSNCNLQGALCSAVEVHSKRSKHENLSLAAKSKGGFKQRKKDGKVSEQPKPSQTLQKESYNKNHLKGFGTAQKKAESTDSKFASTKTLRRGMKKNCKLAMTANLKASNAIGVVQNAKGKKSIGSQAFDEPQSGTRSGKLLPGRKSGKSQAVTKSCELLAGRKSNGTNLKNYSKSHMQSSHFSLESEFRLNKSETFLDNDEFISISVGKKRKRGRQVEKSSNGICSASIIIAGKTTGKNNAGSKNKKNRRGGCGLLVRSSGKGDNFDRFSSTSKRTILSWLIDIGAVFENEMVRYINKEDNTILKYGWMRREGILCKCCDRVMTILNFEAHAGSKLLQPWANVFLESGKSLTECQRQAWAEQSKSWKVGMCVIDVDKGDRNDDTCGLCGDGGDLLCCDNCPSTFHQDCLLLKDLPEGDWYCPHCRCAICATVGNEAKAEVTDTAVLFCDQCEHKYHKECLHGRGILEGGFVSKNIWLCGQDCEKVSTGLCELLAISNPLKGGFSWTLLRRVEEDKEVCSPERLAVMAECNAKLAVALVVMEECFVPMVDPRTNLDMIPHVVYNCGSNFRRLNYRGFYTVVLENGDEIISVASIRIHGARLAEMPFVGTRHQYRRQGMCRRLVSAIEEMLLSLKVEKLILPAIPDLLETWTTAFCFRPLENSHKEEIKSVSMMVFPGTTLLQKSLCKPVIAKDEQTGVDNVELYKGVVDSEAHALVSCSDIQSHEKARASPPGCEFSNEISIVNTLREIAAVRVLPETEKKAAISEALLERRDDKDSEIALGGGAKRNSSEPVSGQANIESPAFLKLKESIKLVPASSDKAGLLGSVVHHLHPGTEHHGDSSALEDSTALQRKAGDIENLAS